MYNVLKLKGSSGDTRSFVMYRLYVQWTILNELDVIIGVEVVVKRSAKKLI